MPDFNYAAAKQAGYTDAEITAFLAAQKPTAQSELVQPVADTAPLTLNEQPQPVPPPERAVMSSVMTGARQMDRPTLTDVVRPIAKSYGPAEQMRSMTLIEFRRLGQGADESARHVIDTFKHLQHESFTVWVEAVAGWRQGDICQLYLAMGRESLERGVPIAQVISDRGRNGQPYLSEHEFTVVADLNRQLQQ